MTTIGEFRGIVSAFATFARVKCAIVNASLAVDVSNPGCWHLGASFVNLYYVAFSVITSSVVRVNTD